MHSLKSFEVETIDINLIEPNPYQPRKIMDNTEIKKLSDSIKIHGLIQPISVKKINKSQYILVAGQRRLEACKLANIYKIEVSIIDVADSKLRELAIVENIHRKDLSCVEIAISIHEMILKSKSSQKDISELLQMNKTKISKFMSIAKNLSKKQQDDCIANHYNKLDSLAELLAKHKTQDEIDIVLSVMLNQNLSYRHACRFMNEIVSNDFHDNNENENEIIEEENCKKTNDPSITNSFAKITRKKDNNLSCFINLGDLSIEDKKTLISNIVKACDFHVANINIMLIEEELKGSQNVKN